MTIYQALKKYNNIEIELLLVEVIHKPKEFLFMSPEYRMSENQRGRLMKMIKRRQKGEPIAYILGYKDFFGLRFKVNKNVLIPRPETEGLVERIIQRIKKQELRSKNKKQLTILDVGTGSGCIIISLAKLFSSQYSSARHQLEPQAIAGGVNSTQFYAADISKKALKVAKENTKNHKVKIKFIHSDILQNVRMSFDIIVANLPYVPVSDYRQLKKSLQYEPKQAIFAKTQGLALIEKLLKQISRLKKQPKAVFLEFDSRQKAILKKLINEYLPKAGVKFCKDLNNLWRYAVIFVK